MFGPAHAAVAARLLKGDVSIDAEVATWPGSLHRIESGDWQHFAPTGGYMVSVPQYGIRIHRDLPSGIETITGWLADVWRHVDEGGFYFGSWVDGDYLYVDVSERWESFSGAITIAAARGELAIWDVEEGREIRLDGK